MQEALLAASLEGDILLSEPDIRDGALYHKLASWVLVAALSALSLGTYLSGLLSIFLNMRKLDCVISKATLQFLLKLRIGRDLFVEAYTRLTNLSWKVLN